MESVRTSPAEELSRLWRFINFQLRIWPHCVKLLIKNRATQIAAALSFQTIFGIVPLAIILLMVFAWINSISHLGFSVKNLLFEQAFFNVEYPDPQNPSAHITLAEKIDQIVTDAMAGINTGSITIVGVVFVVGAALALLITIEQAFNTIYHVPEQRSIARRIVNYWTLLTLGPLLIGAGIYASAQYKSEVQISLVAYISPFISHLVPFLMTFIAFFLLYLLLPNVKVRIKPALWGAAIATLVWSLAKWGFSIYVIKGIPYWKIYGLMGLIPLAVFWIYLSWLIVLFGLELTYTTQNIRSIEEAEAEAAHETHFIANDFTVINIMRFISQAFLTKRGPVEVQALCRHLKLPPEFANKILAHLVEKGLLIKTVEPNIGFTLATEPANIKLSEITDAVSAVSLGHHAEMQSRTLAEIAKKQKDLFGQYAIKDL